MDVKFKYKYGSWVVTPFGDDGIVEMCGVDKSGICYYIKTKTNSQWLKQEEISEKVSS